MNTEKYNGWTNYETWNYALWLDNDQGTQEYWAERAQECFLDARDPGEISDPQIRACTRTRKENAANELSKMLEQEAQEFAQENVPQKGWLADAVNVYLGEVDFYEIAEHFLADIEEEATEEGNK